MQQVFADEFLRLHPAAEVIIASPFPLRDEGYYGDSLRVVRSRRRNLPVATMSWLALTAARALRLKANRCWWNTEIDAMARADAVIDLSGDMLTEDYGTLIGYSHFLPLLQAQALGLPTFLCAQSIGPFQVLKPLAQHVLSRASLVTVRERISFDCVSDLVSEGRLRLTADLAFLLRPAANARVDQLLSHEQIPLTGRRPWLGVSVSALLSNSRNRHIQGIGGDKLGALSAALDHIASRHGLDILLVSHVLGGRANDDREVAHRLAEKMSRKPLMLRGEYRPEELKGVIARCEAFVGCRMHANIAALDSEVPVLAIGYSHKTRGILAEFGLSKWAIAVEDLEEPSLETAVGRLLAQAGDYRERLHLKLPAIRERAADNVQHIAQMIAKEAAR